ncbi:MAG: hypothetical protein OEW11_06045 [Nitrospirota bacterium]|nr:hypothetical protein [Nitrospirota bacterium]
MHCIQKLVTRAPLAALITATCLALGTPGSAAAIGPVTPGSLPGGVTVTDSDTVSGAQWGRSGGRTITYAVANPAGFAALSWGIVNGTTPEAAFDNAIDGLDFAVTPRPGERMTFNPAESSLASGVARWTGEAQIQLVAPGVTRVVLPTRFTLTVTNPAPLAFMAGGAAPGVDVLANTPGTFTVNWLFEAKAPGSTVWEPLLDLFDRLPTGIGADGFAHTSLSSGFYYELPGGGGLTLETHDANISAQVAAVKNDTGFLKIEAVNRLVGLADDLTALRNQVNTLPRDFQFPQIPPDIATRNDVNGASERLSQTLLTLFGIMPCPPEAGPVCDTATFINDLATLDALNAAKTEVLDATGGLATRAGLDAARAAVLAAMGDLITQASLDAAKADIVAMLDASNAARLDVRAVEIGESEDGKLRRWLLFTTQQGSPIEASPATALAIVARKGSPATAEDVTPLMRAVPVSTGVLDVTIELPKRLRKTVAFQFDMFAMTPTAAARGSALVGVENDGEHRD